MILFLADGRLGNQIFQYAFLKTIQKSNEKIIVSGFENLLEIFEIDDVINLNKKNLFIRLFLFRLFKPLLNLLAKAKIFSSIGALYEFFEGGYRRESTEYWINMGCIKQIKYVKSGYFQSEKFFKPEIIENLKIKEKYFKEADEFLKAVPKNMQKVVIHVRRGDYKNFKVFGKDTLLPIHYYKDQIKWFLETRENSYFIFLSDEPEFVEKEFGNIPNKIVSKGLHYGVDLAIMTKCESAILSPSSFGWWGAYLMEKCDKIFVPKYWLGFSSNIEYPKGAVASHMDEVEL